PEIRIDPLSGRRTIIAGERSRRPGGHPGLSDAQLRPEPIDPAEDPFAEGNEQRTPPELYALRPHGGPPNSPGWLVRVVQNPYPALDAPDAAEDSGGSEGNADGSANAGHGNVAAGADRGATGAAQELFASMPASGAHE